MPTLIFKARRRFRRTLRITMAWLVLGVLAALHESGAIAAHGFTAPFGPILQKHLLQALIGGLLIGGAYVFILHDRLRRVRFIPAISIVVALIAAGMVVSALAMNGIGGWDDLWSRFTLSRYLDLSLVMCGTMLMLRVNDQYGSGNADHLLGRLRKPRQELRIFMFLDMRSSTSVAETIGDTRYFQLLNDLYADITDPVIYSEGDIYQYVGDEISVSWRLDRGVRNDRCIRCFFAIRGKLRQRAGHYQKNYGIEPVFKAGFHFGHVTKGEVGLVKKQTIFSGDVVNTVAHIQASCNALGVDNLLSKDLYDVLTLPSQRYAVRAMGSIPLKGKRHAMELFSIGLKDGGQ